MTTIKLKNGSGAPTTGDLVQGEPALDLTNKRLYTEDSSGTVIEVGTNPTSVTTGAITGSGDMAIDTDTLFVDVSADAVGIGTASPNATLKVQGPVDTATISTSSTPAARINNGGAISNWIGANGYNYGYIQSIQDDGTNNLKPLVLQPLGGNVGIGTSSPDTPLTVSVADNTIATRFKGTNGIFRVLPFETGLGVKVTALNGDESAFETLAYQAEDHQFVTGTTERMRIDASGQVGIGVTPSNWSSSLNKVLQISSSGFFQQDTATNVGLGRNAVQNGAWRYIANGYAQMLNLESDGAFKFFQAGSGTAGNTVSFSQAMTLDTSGNLLVGTTSFANPTSGFTVSASTETKIQINHIVGTGSGVPFATFRYNQSEIGSITQNGTSAVLYNTSSDQRLKENITDANDAGDKIDAIKVRQYDWKADGSHQDYGMVAQELMTVAPEAVSVPEDPEQMMGVDYSKLVPMMLKEIQSLRARVAQLEGAN